MNAERPGADMQHHMFLGADHARNARASRWVIVLTVVTMVVEIVAGMLSGSMALTADGWHMATHAGAMAITVFAYGFARNHADDPRFSFGTGKVGDLAAFANAILLAGVSILIAIESVERLARPQPIAFSQAILVACIGLGVNILSAWLLRDAHGHDHGGHGHGHGHHDHAHAHDHAHHDAAALRAAHGGDTNLRAAYIHVLADAVTSVAAIVALVGARTFGWNWLDPVMGLVGSVVILRWAWSLARQTGFVLLDAVPDAGLAARIRGIVEGHGDRITDFHLWQVGPGHHAAIVCVAPGGDRIPAYRETIERLPGISHVTIDVRHGVESA